MIEIKVTNCGNCIFKIFMSSFSYCSILDEG